MTVKELAHRTLALLHTRAAPSTRRGAAGETTSRASPLKETRMWASVTEVLKETLKFMRHIMAWRRGMHSLPGRILTMSLNMI
ncbi:hypothetical protein E2C01_022746 [Portunus trituberculatus]|uniref:Uncharacterized protein n=1 Tax=Portunus trituberculatus TaxID=210409 RepID=A0A5B7E6U7_PORTR|nr:hypothetical protein [Portunus trituberculatus]